MRPQQACSLLFFYELNRSKAGQFRQNKLVKLAPRHDLGNEIFSPMSAFGSMPHQVRGAVCVVCRSNALKLISYNIVLLRALFSDNCIDRTTKCPGVTAD